jgi:predicted aldo/keto reductase-like oxidoreductase
MKYRKFGKLDWKVSALGFGTMRLPVLNNDSGIIDEQPTISMLRYAIDHGVNYIDTAYGYHKGNAEVVIGKALKDGYRDKVRIATKLPIRDVRSYSDFDRFLNEQLHKLQTEVIDFYLLHGLDSVEWPKMRDLGVIEWAEKAMKTGRFRYLGFSFHSSYETFQRIVDSYDNWTLCQFQYNYMAENFQAGTRGMEYAHKKDIAVVAMGPIKAGRLASPPAKVDKIWTSTPLQKNPQEWALRWVWNHPEVTTALSGMSTLKQVIENIASAEYSEPSNLTGKQLALISQVRDAYRSYGPVSCFDCHDCLPCPRGVDIPTVFDYYNEAVIYNSPVGARQMYNIPGILDVERRGDKCDGCSICIEKCPHNIAIPEMLAKAHAFLTTK